MFLVLSLSLTNSQKKNLWLPMLLDAQSHLKIGGAELLVLIDLYAFLLLKVSKPHL
jgi:hypothetical protein